MKIKKMGKYKDQEIEDIKRFIKHSKKEVNFISSKPDVIKSDCEHDLAKKPKKGAVPCLKCGKNIWVHK